MVSQDYRAVIAARIPAADAFQKINRVSDWWTRGFTGTSSKKGDRFTVRFGDTFVDFQVAESTPTTRIVWEATDCNLAWITDKKEWKGTRVVWDLAAKDGVTEVSMTHFGLVPSAECYDNCKPGWDFYVTRSLQKLLAEDLGLPDGKGRGSRP